MDVVVFPPAEQQAPTRNVFTTKDFDGAHSFSSKLTTDVGYGRTNDLKGIFLSRGVQELVKRITRKEKEAVHEFVYARGTRELLHVRWDGNEYWLESASGQCCNASLSPCIDGSICLQKRQLMCTGLKWCW